MDIYRLGLSDLDTIVEFVSDEMEADRNYSFDTGGLPNNPSNWPLSELASFVKTNGHSLETILGNALHTGYPGETS